MKQPSIIKIPGKFSRGRQQVIEDDLEPCEVAKLFHSLEEPHFSIFSGYYLERNSHIYIAQKERISTKECRRLCDEAVEMIFEHLFSGEMLVTTKIRVNFSTWKKKLEKFYANPDETWKNLINKQ